MKQINSVKKAVVDACAFTQSMNCACTVLSTSVFPALENVQLHFKNGKCTFVATDLNVWLVAEIPAQGDSFTCAFQHTKLVNKLCRLYDGTLTVEVRDCKDENGSMRTICLTCASRSAEFAAFLPHDVFPELPEFTAKTSFAVCAETLYQRIDHVRYAALPDKGQTSAQRISVQFAGNQIFALDGYRAACDTDLGLMFPTPMLLSAGTLTHLKLFGGQQIHVESNGQYARFSAENLSLYIRLLEAQPFRLMDAVPKSFQETFSICPKEFLGELDFLKKAMPPKMTPHFRFSQGKISLLSEDTQCYTSISVDGTSQIDFGFDLTYMLDAMQQFKQEESVRLKVKSPLEPIVIEADGRSDFAMVLPIRLKGSALRVA